MHPAKLPDLVAPPSAPETAGRTAPSSPRPDAAPKADFAQTLHRVHREKAPKDQVSDADAPQDKAAPPVADHQQDDEPVAASADAPAVPVPTDPQAVVQTIVPNPTLLPVLPAPAETQVALPVVVAAAPGVPAIPVGQPMNGVVVPVVDPALLAGALLDGQEVATVLPAGTNAAPGVDSLALSLAPALPVVDLDGQPIADPSALPAAVPTAQALPPSVATKADALSGTEDVEALSALGLQAIATVGPAIATGAPIALKAAPKPIGEEDVAAVAADTDVVPTTATSAAVPPAPAPVAANNAVAGRLQATALKLNEHERPSAGTGKEDAAQANGRSSFTDLLASNTQALPPAPAGGNPPVRPLSEAIAAQAALATGNAAEKAVSNQVGQALVRHLPGGERMLIMRLTPPELGTVRIEVIERQGVLSARLHAEDDGVRVALERFLPQMQRDLRAQDAPIRELSLADQTQFDRSFSDTSRQSRDPDARPSRTTRDGETFAVDGMARSEPELATVRQLGGRSNVRGVDAFA